MNQEEPKKPEKNPGKSEIKGKNPYKLETNGLARPVRRFGRERIAT
jgi:hypothetical protein